MNTLTLTTCTVISLTLPTLMLQAAPSSADAAVSQLTVVEDVEWQPFAAQAQRVREALNVLGQPITPEDDAQFQAALQDANPAQSIRRLQAVLDRYCLIGVNINPEMRVKAMQGAAKPELLEQGWRVFLIKVHNEAGTTAELRAVSPQAESLYEGGAASNASDKAYRKGDRSQVEKDAKNLWCDVDLFKKQPLKKELSGLRLEYAVLQMFSRDSGSREAKLAFSVGQGTQDLGFRNEVDVLFKALPASSLTLQVRDESGKPTTAAFVIRDLNGRVYPPQSKRLAPDFGFHPQVYRADGESLRLPEGQYRIEVSRGPEYLAQHLPFTKTTKSQTLKVKCERWIDPSVLGWWSGDHHIHAAGCAHYTNPSEGVHAVDMMRHCVGEDLKVGCNLTWGPCFDYQKQFFTGKIDKVSKYPYLLRYDIEVSGFGSHQSGHLCLLRLKEEMYPGGTSKNHWPTLGLNTLRWAKKQGGVVGPAHSGWGLAVDTAELPNYVVPPLDGIGANEYLIDVTHMVPGPDGQLVPAVDFMSTVDTPYVWELNMWYHTLNCGFRTRISGETDFPCIYGERVGLGRSYVKLGRKLDFDEWCEGIRQGRNYVSDGRSHLIDFKVHGLEVGTQGSEVRLDRAQVVRVEAKVAAMLNPEADPSIRKRSYTDKPYWDIERARIPDSRNVPVEVLVNGYPVAQKVILADGHLEPVSFDIQVDRSSWVALRVLPSSHSNPVFVLVGDKPIRASKRSAEWCLKGVDRCWSQKDRFIKADEKQDAKEAYDHARQVYQQRLAECEVP